MSCPFLKESRVRYCEVSPVRTMIPHTDGSAEAGRCSSPAHESCRLFEGRRASAPALPECPFLRETLVQSCAAAPVTRFIPFSEALASSCQTEGHRYCDLFISWAEPDRGASRRGRDTAAGGVEVPERLAFSRNHMWIEAGEDGTWHIGLDDFFAKTAGEVERVVFLSGPGFHRPAAAITVAGVDLRLVFPLPLAVSGANTGLRSDPSTIVSDPYRRGWLYQGRCDPGSEIGLHASGHGELLRGGRALEWMQGETKRIDRLVRGHLDAGPCSEMLNDGGIRRLALPRLIRYEDRFRILNSLFPAEARRSEP